MLCYIENVHIFFFKAHSVSVKSFESPIVSVVRWITTVSIGAVVGLVWVGVWGVVVGWNIVIVVVVVWLLKGVVVLGLVGDLVNHKTNVPPDVCPVASKTGILKSEWINQIGYSIVDLASVVENVVYQLVDVDDGVEVVKEDLVVLEATEEASKGDGVDWLDHSLESVAELVIELKIYLGNNNINAVIESGDVADADWGVWGGDTNGGVEETNWNVIDNGPDGGSFFAEGGLWALALCSIVLLLEELILVSNEIHGKNVDGGCDVFNHFLWGFY